MPGRATNWKPSRPTRTTPARRRRTSSTSASSFGPQAKDEGLIQPYKVATWDTIPEAPRIRTATGTATTTASWPSRSTRPSSKRPSDWADLLKPEYKSQVALAGDPRASSQAINGLRRGAGQRRLARRRRSRADFFKQSTTRATSCPIIAKPGTIAQGETPDHHPLDYNALATATQAARQPGDRGHRPRRPAASPVSTSRPSAPSRRIPTPPSCGWSTCTPTRARTSG